ncbi:MAG: exodeoxyribonuclease VII large subunit [Candidatus Liberibacter ctenarytainae]|uniref:Exodeoxyribonuclease 7 large subunit n=1 Tax=Candidatus Liberibacter ctenarytainae TaxID=2020335 RepID=A0A937DGR5_9HYPH|nr:exodeoxyribonuclease VII large subunit [Candidatus Liberibacter ctenarytainae]
MVHFLKKRSFDYPEYSVSELSSHIKNTVESNFSLVCVRGEISGYRGIHTSGHAYFTLKDNQSRIDAVIWKGTLNKIECSPEEGIEFLVFGKITTFPRSSKYQIIIESLIPYGIGTLMTILEERKKKLREEGIFSDDLKKPLPFMPKIIAVITSPSGAVIRDILQRISCRFPLQVIVFPTKVQGNECPEEITNAIHQLNTLEKDSICPKPDIIILARGGGSLEDLWHFNDEMVVRAVANSHIPIISAVGHETDWTLVDYAADLRAPTPTGAAEMAVPVKASLKSSLIGLETRLQDTIYRYIHQTTNHYLSLKKSLLHSDQVLASPRYCFDRLSRELEHGLEIKIFRKYYDFNNTIMKIKSNFSANYINNHRQNVIQKQQYIAHHLDKKLRCIQLKIQQKDIKIHILCEQIGFRIAQMHIHIEELFNRVDFMTSHKMKDYHTSILNFNRILESLSYHNTLKRGYAIVRDSQENPILELNNLSVGTNILIEWFEGRSNAIITDDKYCPIPDFSEKRIKYRKPKKQHLQIK